MSAMNCVLCIEDDSDDVFFIKRAAQHAGIADAFRFAQNGKAAMEYLDSAVAAPGGTGNPVPQLILLDLNMPLMSGLDFLQWLRQAPQFKHLPAIVLTSSANPKDILQAYSTGANAYVVKPANLAEMGEVFTAIKSFWFTHNRYG